MNVTAAHYLAVMQTLRDAPGCQFEQLMDLAGEDYSAYREVATDGPRFGVTVHLLSVSLNQRVRVKVLSPDDYLPLLDSVNALLKSANWDEREAFCRYRLVFEVPHDPLPIPPDAGFIRPHFRTDFPLSRQFVISI